MADIGGGTGGATPTLDAGAACGAIGADCGPMPGGKPPGGIAGIPGAEGMLGMADIPGTPGSPAKAVSAAGFSRTKL
jgi:hypothetical protein